MLIGLVVIWAGRTVFGQDADNSANSANGSEITRPQVLDSSMNLELFASEPDIVTPTGCTFDSKGRLLVIESHTHQRPDDYQGPETDRIRIVEDTDADGRADRFRTFFEGTEHTMSIRSGPNGWIYVATRAKIFRIRDTDGDDVADENQVIVHLETNGDYPHNGLSGLAIDTANNLYFGMGENLGAPYRMIGSDGSAQRGSGEGGVFRCDLSGGKLERIATGFWNPFGICVDPVGRIFAVGNDADGRPPSRLVQIVETGDYGFQYRYGRSGIHPLQAWDGELPGTLPMVSGTGEAPCELVVHNGRLVTGSWGDFRVERYELVSNGASFHARREIVVQGDENFRPVAFADSPDGSLFFTDWVDKSYPVHGKGRIWRLSSKQQPKQRTVPELSPIEVKAIKANAASQRTDWEALASPDRFLRQHAIAGLVKSDNSKNRIVEISLSKLESANSRLALLQAVRWHTEQSRANPLPAPLDRIREGLADSDPAVRLYAVRWVADAELKEFRTEVADQLTRFSDITPALFNASVAALEYLDTGMTTFDPKNTLKYALRMVRDETQSPAIRAMALRTIPVDEVGKSLSVNELIGLSKLANSKLGREAVRTLVLSRHKDRLKALLAIATTEHLPKELQRDVAWGLKTSGTNGQQQEKPPIDELDEWMKVLEIKGVDANRGWRVFHDRAQLNCASCHTVQGRGGQTGPDLTNIVSRTSRRDVLESILKPSQNIAPQYVPTIMVTDKGKTLVGLWQGHDEEGKLEVFQDSQGKFFSVDPNKIVERRVSETSIMPDDLHKSLTVDQIRDLLAFLEQE